MKHQFSENKDITDILNSFESYLSNKQRSENTIKTYVGVLLSFFQWLENRGKSPKNVTKEDIYSYIQHLESQHRSLSTIKKVINTINTFAKSINRKELLFTIQSIKTDSNKDAFSPDYLIEDEVKKLFLEVEASGNERNIAIAYTLLETGIRVSELCSLNIVDVELNYKNQTGQITIKDKKEINHRTIPLTRRVVHHLKRYLNTRNDEEEALFLSNYEKRIAARTVQHMLKQYGVHPHKLRHTFCYNLVQKGLDLSMVAQLAGHTDIQLLKQYLKVTAENESNEQYA